MALTKLEVQYVNLTPAQKEYFEHLAANSDDEPIDYFEKVPEELRDDPKLVEAYLNGDPELGTPDRDWSHHESRHNGGSDDADNGQFEDASTNRSRGSANMTEHEMTAADESDLDTVADLTEDVDTIARTTVMAEVIEVGGGLAEFGLDVFAPLVGGGLAAKAVIDRQKTLKSKIIYGGLTGTVVTTALTTPPGAFCLGLYMTYKLGRTGIKFWQKRRNAR